MEGDRRPDADQSQRLVGPIGVRRRRRRRSVGSGRDERFRHSLKGRRTHAGSDGQGADPGLEGADVVGGAAAEMADGAAGGRERDDQRLPVRGVHANVGLDRIARRADLVHDVARVAGSGGQTGGARFAVSFKAGAFVGWPLGFAAEPVFCEPGALWVSMQSGSGAIHRRIELPPPSE